MFRKPTVSAEDAIERSHEIYGPLGAQGPAWSLRRRCLPGCYSGVPALPNVKTARRWRGIVALYAPRAGGAYDSHHRTAGIAGCTRRRGAAVWPLAAAAASEGRARGLFSVSATA